MTATYRPYLTASKEISGLPRASKRELLAYERLAEEGLSKPAHISRVLKWTSFVSNAAAGALIASSAGNNSTKVFGGLASAMSFLPLFFDHEWEHNHNRQQDYKRRVYGPVTNDFGLGRNGQHLAGIWTGTVVF
jgi:hypothetical protein